ncbi:MAG: D-amino acid aminotransferase [Gammaproteobacteria bacterium]|nr:D-amino acid aminotransferase [Gammaproteobacteria bacterium]
MNTVYLNGQFIAREQATVSVLDRGFLLGDGVYEVIPVYHGKAFRLEQHLQRLENSLHAIHLPPPLNARQWTDIVGRLIQLHGGGDQSLYLQVTRGPGMRDHLFPTQINPTVFAMTTRLPVAGTAEPEAASALCLADSRWEHCNIKSISLLANILAKQQAFSQGKSEAFLIRDGLLTEGTASNVFMVKDGVIVTPPNGPHLLPGVTRDLILELAHTHQMPAQERDISQDELYLADEIWLTSSAREIVPVTELDNRPVGNGQPGPVWRQMLRHYRQFKANLATQA